MFFTRPAPDRTDATAVATRAMPVEVAVDAEGVPSALRANDPLSSATIAGSLGLLVAAAAHRGASVVAHRDDEQL